MRADRLLSILMLLQTRGTMTARELARTLEVCERTIYRDIDALGAAGVPVYGEAGRTGGYALLDSYRTSLTGLTEGQVRALFMLSIPAPLAELEVSEDLRVALLKLAAALPDTRRDEAQRVRERFYLDAAPWHHAAGPLPQLEPVYRAVWHDRRLLVRYRPAFPAEIEQVVDPYGLVVKAGIWYLVSAANDKTRVLPVAELLEVRVLEDQFTRPPGFDLDVFWAAWCAGQEQRQGAYPVLVRVAPGFLSFLPRYFGDTVLQALNQGDPADTLGRITFELRFESLEGARERLLACGCGVEVLAPPALRRSIQDYAQQILGLYGAEQA